MSKSGVDAFSVTVAVDFGGRGPRAGREVEVVRHEPDKRPWVRAVRDPDLSEPLEPRDDHDDDAAPTDRPPCRAARLLALAEFVERRIEAGDLRDLAEAAERFGVTRARMTQIANLALLAPDIQEELLLGRRADSERRMRAAAGKAEWADQLVRRAAWR